MVACPTTAWLALLWVAKPRTSAEVEITETAAGRRYSTPPPQFRDDNLMSSGSRIPGQAPGSTPVP